MALNQLLKLYSIKWDTVEWLLNDKSGWLWEEEVIAYLNVLSQHQFRVTEENHEAFKSALPVPWLKFKLGASWKQVNCLSQPNLSTQHLKWFISVVRKWYGTILCYTNSLVVEPECTILIIPKPIIWHDHVLYFVWNNCVCSFVCGLFIDTVSISDYTVGMVKCTDHWNNIW